MNAFSQDCTEVSDIKLSKELVGKFIETKESYSGQLGLQFTKKSVVIDGTLKVSNNYEPLEGVSEEYQNGWLHDFFTFDFKKIKATRIQDSSERSVFQHILSDKRGSFDITELIGPDNYYEITIVTLNKIKRTATLEQIQFFRPEYLEFKKKGLSFLMSKEVSFRNKKNTVELKNCH